MTTWYEAQFERDALARAESERHLGPEASAFADAMQLTEDALAVVVSDAAVADLATKRKVSFATHGFNLLWAAWDQALAGRYDASRAYSRSISEVPDFLEALDANPHLASQMGSGKVDVEAAWRTLRARLKGDARTHALELLSQKERAHKSLQRLSHVSVEVINHALCPKSAGQAKIGVLRPGGMVSEHLLRPIAIDLACSAMELMGSTVKSFLVKDEILHLWQSRGLPTMERHASALADEVNLLQPLTGEFDRFVFIRSLEHIDDSGDDR